MTEREQALEQALDVISKAKAGEGIASELPDIMVDAILEARAQEAERNVPMKWMAERRAYELRVQKGKL